jgi:hypothetical protein
MRSAQIIVHHRLEREENERIAAAKKEKMEQLKRQLEEEKRSQADGGVVYRGMSPKHKQE